MIKLIVLSAVVMFLALFHEYFSKIDNSIGQYIYKEKFFFIIIAVIMIFFSGLRITYNDTATYILSYNALAASFENIDWKLGSNPGFQIVNIILKSLGASSQTFLLFYSAVTVGLYLWFIRKYSVNFIMSLFIFIAGGMYAFSFAAVKQCVAIAIALLGVDKALKKKWVSFVFWILLASTFHTYALMFLVTPFIIFKPWTKKTYILLAAGTLFGFSFRLLIGRILTIVSLMGESYDMNSIALGDGVNLFRLAVAWAPIALAFLARKQIKKCDDDRQNLILNFSMLNAILMFTACFGTAFYIARLANYFGIFQVLVIPALLKYYDSGSRKFLKASIYIGFAGFAVYAYGINRAFDIMYTRVSLIDYLSGLF